MTERNLSTGAIVTTISKNTNDSGNYSPVSLTSDADESNGENNSGNPPFNKPIKNRKGDQK